MFAAVDQRYLRDAPLAGNETAVAHPRWTRVRSEPLIPGFPHDKHRPVNCIHCHHNFVDRNSADSCISCHRSGRAPIRVGAEARFHDFCLGCHRKPPAYLTGDRPVTGCKTCHAPL
jgi:predicted CXXCH cytochrome family protein